MFWSKNVSRQAVQTDGVLPSIIFDVLNIFCVQPLVHVVALRLVFEQRYAKTAGGLHQLNVEIHQLSGARVWREKRIKG